MNLIETHEPFVWSNKYIVGLKHGTLKIKGNSIDFYEIVETYILYMRFTLRLFSLLLSKEPLCRFLV